MTDDAACHVECVPIQGVPSSWDAPWRDLATDASEPNPFAESWFVRPAFRHLGHTDGDRMLAVWRGSALIGMIPLTVASRYGRMPVAHVQNWTHYQCFYAAPLMRAGHEREFWCAALAFLDRADWAPHFLHLSGLDPDAAAFTALRATRRADIVHTSERALLKGGSTPAAYYETHVRKKKRKELARLTSRLAELGPVALERLNAGPPGLWISDFLCLEESGWKGRDGSALGCEDATRSFFEEAVSAAHASGKLDFLRLTLAEKPIAMLVNFLTPPGSFSFKIAYDEAYARFSPGVLIAIENLQLLNRPEIEWMDSCAAEDHPMINSLWAGRRSIVRVTVPLAGFRRQIMFHAARTAERTAARWRASA